LNRPAVHGHFEAVRRSKRPYLWPPNRALNSISTDKESSGQTQIREGRAKDRQAENKQQGSPWLVWLQNEEGKQTTRAWRCYSLHISHVSTESIKSAWGEQEQREGIKNFKEQRLGVPNLQAPSTAAGLHRMIRNMFPVAKYSRYVTHPQPGLTYCGIHGLPATVPVAG
jgi:hypothetical protein